MEPITLTIENVQITLKEITRNKVYTCNTECLSYQFDQGPCHEKKQLSLCPAKSNLIATEVIFNVRNTSSISRSLEVKRWELIDTNGFAYHACALCYELHSPRMQQPEYDITVSPGTQVNFVLVFPELEKGKDVACIQYLHGNSFHKFEINKMNPEAIELLSIREETMQERAVVDDGESRQVKYMIDRFESNVFARLNNILIPKEATKLENMIKNEAFTIGMKLKSLNKERRQLFEDRYKSIFDSYKVQLEKVKERENKYKKLDQKIAQLFELSPREFEEYIAELLKALDYERVTLTPLSGDKGIDILAEHNGKKVVIQCKKQKAVVGSPAIQTFLGAIKNAEAQKGLFITTGSFSIEAEKMASKNPIELIDGIALGELIRKALHND